VERDRGGEWVRADDLQCEIELGEEVERRGGTPGERLDERSQRCAREELLREGPAVVVDKTDHRREEALRRDRARRRSGEEERRSACVMEPTDALADRPPEARVVVVRPGRGLGEEGDVLLEPWHRG
jgi:hypothetical protein